MDEKVIRIRPCEMVEDEEDKSVSLCLRDFAQSVLKDITIRGFEEIEKVSYTSDKNTKGTVSTNFNENTGDVVEQGDLLLIETDGVALFKVL